MLDAVIWTALLVPASLAGLPLASLAFQNLPSRGAFLAKPIGVLLVAYTGWLLLFIGPFTNSRGFHLAVLFGIAAISMATRYMIPRLRRMKYPTWRRIAATELIFAVVFLAYAVYRSRNPEIWGTEKPMDFALLNGIFLSPNFPPNDPWFSGHGINYYYFGYAVASALTWASGVKPAVGFNLALGTYLALAFAGPGRSDTTSPASFDLWPEDLQSTRSERLRPRWSCWAEIYTSSTLSATAKR